MLANESVPVGLTEPVYMEDSVSSAHGEMAATGKESVQAEPQVSLEDAGRELLAKLETMLQDDRLEREYRGILNGTTFDNLDEDGGNVTATLRRISSINSNLSHADILMEPQNPDTAEMELRHAKVRRCRGTPHLCVYFSNTETSSSFICWRKAARKRLCESWRSGPSSTSSSSTLIQPTFEQKVPLLERDYP